MGFARQDWEIWSTTAALVVTDPERLDAAREAVDAVLADVDRAANRFDPTSEISTLRPGRDGTAALSPQLRDLVAKALEAAALSAGSVDPTVGEALAALGYDRDIALVLRDGAPVRAVVRRIPGWHRLRLDGDVLRLPAGTRLDLGATAKAVAADLAAAAVAEATGVGVLVDLGGDIATAGPVPGGRWQVVVQDRPGDPATQLALAAGTAIATSSTQLRAWDRGGERMHHIVDPRTGRPADSPWRTVSVVGASCFEANVASTTTLVRGERGLDWLARTGLPARLVHRDGGVVTLPGWPQEAAA